MKTSAAGSSVAPVTGNAIAYFALWYARTKHGIVFDDAELALVMAGGLVATLLFELRRVGSGIKYVFDRMFPQKTSPPE